MNEAGLQDGDIQSLESLSGAISRYQPAIYRVNTNEYMTSIDSYSLWILEMVNYGGVTNDNT